LVNINFLDLGSANLFKIYSVLLIMTSKNHEDIINAVKYFKKAGAQFYSFGCKKGLAL